MNKPAAIKKPAKTVWVISDGIPGHFNQSKGILLALQYHYDLQVEWVELQLKSGLYRRVMGWLLNHSQPALGWLSLFYRGKLPASPPDLLVGAGGKSAFAVAWLGQVFQAQTIFAGSLRKLKAELFDAILVLEPDLASPFISLQTSPMPINQTLLQQAAEHWQTAHHIPPKPLWTILIGGDGAGAVYQDRDWQALAGQLNLLAEKHSIQWLLTTSRRTGSRAEQLLRQHLKAEVLADAVWWSLQQPAVTPTVTHPVTYSVTLAYLGLSDMVFCTVDSMSMMMESISAMRPVVSLIPEQFKPDTNFQAAIERLQQQKLVVQIKIDGLAQQSEQFMQLQPLSQEPCLKLADALQKRLSKTQ